MNKWAVFGIYMFVGLVASAQTVVVKSEAQGFSTEIDDKKEEVFAAWTKT